MIRIASFRMALNEVVHRRLDSSRLAPSLEADAELPLGSLSDGFLKELEFLAPFGQGNPRPVFLSRDARIPEEGRKTAFDPSGIRFTVEDGQGRSFEALQPRHELAEGINPRRLPPGPVNLAYSPVRRRGAGGWQVTLKLCDLKPAS